jgi:hypothetical protein
MAPDRLPDPIRVALSVAATLEGLGVPYVAVGSLASSVHGAPRSTDDVDFVVDLAPVQGERLVTALTDAYYVSPDAVRAATGARSGGTFNAIHLATSVKVDLFVAGDDPFDAERLAQRRRVAVASDASSDLFIDTAEHTILRKLEWYRRGGEVSERQWSDVIGVMRAQRDRLDRATLQRWAERLGVADLLERALREGSPT